MKGSIKSEEIAMVDIYALGIGASKHLKPTFKDLKGRKRFECDNSENLLLQFQKQTDHPDRKLI